MYDYIKGPLASITPTQVVIDIQGVGYLFNISLHTYSAVEKKKETKLFIYQVVREDDLQLYGFDSEFERFVFKNLVSVSGIGPNTARVVLSFMTPEETRDAILHENEFAFKKVKGVGPKTAKRIIIDLKDKMMKASGEAGTTNSQITSSVTSSIQSEATSALLALGFVKQKISKVINLLSNGSDSPKTVEDLIKKALKELS